MKKSVFFLAHYDDEFGIYEEIRLHIIQKIPLHIVYLTSSNINGISEESRERESLSALKKLGVEKENVSFIGKEMSVPDLALKDHLIASYINSKNLIENLGNVGKIFTLAYEGGHPDHDSINFLCSRLISKHASKIEGWQFPLYCGPGLIGSFFYLFKPLKNNGPITKKRIEAKNIRLFLKLIFCYKSQFKTFIGLYPFYLLHMVFKKYQVTQKINPSRIYNRPHKGRLLYERRKMDEFEQLKLKMSEFDLWLNELPSKQHID